MVATAIRGHVFANAEGRYHFRTILPALYPGRTRQDHCVGRNPRLLRKRYPCNGRGCKGIAAKRV